MSSGNTDKRDGKALIAMGLDPSEIEAAPAGVHLSALQAQFVAAYVEHGGNLTLAGAAAGLAPGRETRAMLAHPGVMAAIRREAALQAQANVAAADMAIGAILTGAGADREKIAAAKVAFERVGVMKRAELEAEREAAAPGDMSRMSEAELERLIEATAAKIAARRPGDGVVLDGSGAPDIADGIADNADGA